MRGLATVLQRVPFQCSISCFGGRRALAKPEGPPTAQASSAASAATARNAAPSTPALGTTLQLIAHPLPDEWLPDEG
jgi:hypothetical protein